MTNQPNMIKSAKFSIAAVLIATALFTLRFCYPHSSALDKQEHADPKHIDSR
jgi:hypothetical protein